jgi:peroxiredoxin
MTHSVLLPDMIVHYRHGGQWFHEDISSFFPPNNKTLLVSVKGAFISNREALFYDSAKLPYDNIVLTCVNDTFVMNAWAAYLDLKRVMLLPDGNGILAKYLGVAVDYTNEDLGIRGWRGEWLVARNSLRYLGDLTC